MKPSHPPATDPACVQVSVSVVVSRCFLAEVRWESMHGERGTQPDEAWKRRKNEGLSMRYSTVTDKRQNSSLNIPPAQKWKQWVKQWTNTLYLPQTRVSTHAILFFILKRGLSKLQLTSSLLCCIGTQKPI